MLLLPWGFMLVQCILITDDLLTEHGQHGEYGVFLTIFLSATALMVSTTLHWRGQGFQPQRSVMVALGLAGVLLWISWTVVVVAKLFFQSSQHFSQSEVSSYFFTLNLMFMIPLIQLEPHEKVAGPFTLVDRVRDLFLDRPKQAPIEEQVVEAIHQIMPGAHGNGLGRGTTTLLLVGAYSSLLLYGIVVECVGGKHYGWIVICQLAILDAAVHWMAFGNDSMFRGWKGTSLATMLVVVSRLMSVLNVHLIAHCTMCTAMLCVIGTQVLADRFKHQRSSLASQVVSALNSVGINNSEGGINNSAALNQLIHLAKVPVVVQDQPHHAVQEPNLQERGQGVAQAREKPMLHLSHPDPDPDPELDPDPDKPPSTGPAGNRRCSAGVVFGMLIGAEVGGCAYYYWFQDTDTTDVTTQQFPFNSPTAAAPATVFIISLGVLWLFMTSIGFREVIYHDLLDKGCLGVRSLSWFLVSLTTGTAVGISADLWIDGTDSVTREAVMVSVLLFVCSMVYVRWMTNDYVLLDGESLFIKTTCCPAHSNQNKVHPDTQEDPTATGGLEPNPTVRLRLQFQLGIGCCALVMGFQFFAGRANSNLETNRVQTSILCFFIVLVVSVMITSKGFGVLSLKRGMVPLCIFALVLHATSCLLFYRDSRFNYDLNVVLVYFFFYPGVFGLLVIMYRLSQKKWNISSSPLQLMTGIALGLASILMASVIAIATGLVDLGIGMLAVTALAVLIGVERYQICLLYTSPSPRDS
eukprot:TRINITY_DN6642_c0_g1_i6.p1 TRINITY_DN6642_c0_g1~~TRINITY_DN6642_c0_g1_i6.p1  ORF type:complete len:750 (+),score=154.79 TRINITY_DN6642_c0_g1_i6:273-2522(+)